MTALNKGIDEKLFNYLQNMINATPYYNFLGLELKALGPGIAEFSLTNKKEHINISGVTHGGVIMSLADAAMANAVRTLSNKISTVEFNTSFLSSIPIGKILIAKGKVTKSGNKLIFAESKIYCDQRLVASHKATFYRFGNLEID